LLDGADLGIAVRVEEFVAGNAAASELSVGRLVEAIQKLAMPRLFLWSPGSWFGNAIFAMSISLFSLPLTLA
jgi:hypothetical protein